MTWSVEERDGRIVVRFPVHVSALDGRASAARFVALLGERRMPLVFDLRETRAYETDARKAWQSAVWPVRGQIESITVAARSSVPRMGAFLFATFLGIECHVVDDLPP